MHFGQRLARHVVVPRVPGTHKCERENGVRARRNIVHLRRRGRALLVTTGHALLIQQNTKKIRKNI